MIFFPPPSLSTTPGSQNTLIYNVSYHFGVCKAPIVGSFIFPQRLDVFDPVAGPDYNIRKSNKGC